MKRTATLTRKTPLARTSRLPRRRAGRQFAHDAAASARAAEKREERRLEIARRPRGRTEAIGQRADGRPIYRAIPAFRARGYTPPEQRKERPEPAIVAVNGWRYNVRPTSERVEAALKAEAPQPPTLEERYVAAYRAGLYEAGDELAERDAKTWRQRAARKVRMAAKRRRGW